MAAKSELRAMINKIEAAQNDACQINVEWTAYSGVGFP